MNKKKILALSGALIGFYVILGLNNNLVVSKYSLSSDKIRGKIRLVQISDLHSSNYGYNQEVLLEKVASLEPDIILLTGDIIDDIAPMKDALIFLDGIKNLAPCYYVTGNHEAKIGNLDKVKEIISNFGIHVLDGRSERIKIGSDWIQILGLDDPTWNKSGYREQLQGLEGVQKTDFSILLAHRPDLIEDYNRIGPDLVCSGHAHGGQWRLPPFISKGLLAPNQGFFPKYTRGLEKEGHFSLLVSRGLSTVHPKFPRLYNPPELVCLDLIGR